MVEQSLNATGIEMVFQLPDPCKSTFLSYACSVAYPRPVTTGESNSFNVLFACGSTCQTVNQVCGADTAYLQHLGQLPASPSILPDCNAPIPNTNQYPGGAIQHQPDHSCNTIPFQSKNSTCLAPTLECASPFVKDLVFITTNGRQNTDDAFCGCGCCLPCPQTDSFYKPGILDKGFMVTDILKGVSAGLSLILVVSYLVLPDKLQHPSNLILFSAISTCIFSAAVAPSYGNPRRIQCAANGITPASSFNNSLCTAQGAWLLFGAISTTAWLSMVIVNLHMHTVWNSNWLSQRAWLPHVIGWVIPAAFAAIAVVTKSIGWNNSNMCMATQDTSNALLFIPLGVIMIPSILLHIATFAHIIRVTLQSENSETVSHSTLSSGKAARISHRRHVMNAIRIQWRAAVLALVVSGSVLIYWAFYLVEGTKTDMSWMSTWQLCIFLGGGNQEQCGRQFAGGHVPDFIFMMIAEGLVISAVILSTDVAFLGVRLVSAEPSPYSTAAKSEFIGASTISLVRRSGIYEPPEGATLYIPPSTNRNQFSPSSILPTMGVDEELVSFTSKSKVDRSKNDTLGSIAPKNPNIISVPLQDLSADTVVITYHTEGKVLDVKYGDGSHVSGVTGLDRMLISGATIANQSFGMASVDDSTIAKKGVEGVVGLGFGRVATVKGFTTVVENMLARKLIIQPIVSMWLGRQRMGGSNEGSGGAVIFGGVDTTKYVGNFTWAPIVDKNAWKIHFDAVSLGGKSLELSGDALIDSGTSLIVVPAKVAKTFHDLITGAQEVPQVGWILPCNTSVGDLNFTISGVQFRVPAEELVLLFRIPGYAEYCKSAIDVSTSSSDEWILGSSFMKNVYSVFNYRSLSVGFAHPSNVYNSLPNVTLLPNLSNSPQGQDNGPNGTQGGGNGSTDGHGSSASTLSGQQ
ncbi:hypothetical protein BGX28_003116 [Mortierella sp. GBA30]|nr:hypothetical protein BGX28_003116 [Mortierella sp. GBA30]